MMLEFTSKVAIYAKKVFESLLIVLFILLIVKINLYLEYVPREQTNYPQELLTCGPTLVIVLRFS